MRRFSQRNSLVTLNEINITPLLDLAFVLLIIFVITRPLLEQNVTLQLPQNMGKEDARIDRNNIRLTMTLESKQANGKTEGLNVIQVITQTGKSFEVAVGDMNLTLTPKLAE